MKWLIAIGLAFMLSGTTAAQTRAPVEAKSHITVLVDLSKTWLNEHSKDADKQTLESVSSAIAALLVQLKPPTEILYFEIGDGSLSRRPLCSARYFPNIFHTTERTDEFADLDEVSTFFADDCTQLLLKHKPAMFTDITGALDTVSRVAAQQQSQYSALIVLSDFKEDRRPHQVGTIGPLRNIHTLLLYRVLDSDRINPKDLDSRVSSWKDKIARAGGSVSAVDDIVVDPAQIRRLLTK
jgi:hypothetical protein